jgi:hypothetical protein
MAFFWFTGNGHRQKNGDVDKGSLMHLDGSTVNKCQSKW